MTLDHLDYWIQKDLYILLLPVASSIRCTPPLASTVLIKREVTRGKSNRLYDDNLERARQKKQNLFVLKFKVSLPRISWSNFAIGIILYFGTTKSRTIELGLEVKLELKLEKQCLKLELELKLDKQL